MLHHPATAAIARVAAVLASAASASRRSSGSASATDSAEYPVNVPISSARRTPSSRTSTFNKNSGRGTSKI